jgi:2,4-dienoyl-CoA reductase-like NADH-dependent reductase (Old Yellow Enzyme family)
MTPEYVPYLEARAAGGAALMFTEAAYVRLDGKGCVRQMGVDADRQIVAIARLVRAAHRQGAKLGAELKPRRADRAEPGARPTDGGAVAGALPARGPAACPWPWTATMFIASSSVTAPPTAI